MGLTENLNNTKEDTAIIAPGIEPIPPNTAATKALIPGIAPVEKESA